MSAPVLVLFKHSLVEGLLEKKTLPEVTLHIVEKMRAGYGGSWYCNIRHADVVHNVALHQVSGIRL